MKKIVFGTLLMALSAPSFAAPVTVKVLVKDLTTIGALQPGGLITAAAIKGLPISLLTVGYSATSGLPILKQTPLPGLLQNLRASARDGNT